MRRRDLTSALKIYFQLYASKTTFKSSLLTFSVSSPYRFIDFSKLGSRRSLAGQ